MDHIIANAETLVAQASMTAADYLHEAVRNIDAKFGAGYAKENPVLVGALVQAAASDYAASLAAAVSQDGSMNVSAISDSLDRIARAIAERD